MVKVNELRIGNHVWGVSDRIEQINEIHAVYVETSFRGGLLHYSEYKDISPIELTADILEKSGFSATIYNKDSGYKQIGKIINGHDFMFTVECNHKPEFYFDMVGTEIIYVHQLQNLYFALIGDELELKF